MTDLLAGYPIVYETDVAWGEMDAFQHVNNVYYFRYFESARVAYLVATGALEAMERTGIGPILHSIGCRYRLPLTYPDRIRVGVRTIALEEDRFTLHHHLVSLRHNRVAAEGDGVVVMYDYRRNVKTAVPDFLRQAIARLEGWEH